METAANACPLVESDLAAEAVRVVGCANALCCSHVLRGFCLLLRDGMFFAERVDRARGGDLGTNFEFKFARRCFDRGFFDWWWRHNGRESWLW